MTIMHFQDPVAHGWPCTIHWAPVMRVPWPLQAKTHKCKQQQTHTQTPVVLLEPTLPRRASFKHIGNIPRSREQAMSKLHKRWPQELNTLTQRASRTKLHATFSRATDDIGVHERHFLGKLVITRPGPDVERPRGHTDNYSYTTNRVSGPPAKASRSKPFTREVSLIAGTVPCKPSTRSLNVPHRASTY